MKRNFLTLSDIDFAAYEELFRLAHKLQKDRLCYKNALSGKTLAMIFEKPSTRTRISFEVGMAQLGGLAIFLSSENTQLSRGEPMRDTAHVLSSMVDMIMLRCLRHEDLEELARHASIPVINGLSDKSHPCQLLADLLTLQSNGKDIKRMTICWVGNAKDNMCRTYIEASHIFDFTLHIACPKKLAPNDALLTQYGGNVRVFNSIMQATKNTDAIITDVWQSMGNSVEDTVLEELKSFQVTSEVFMHANKEAIFMHCLPMKIGQEVAQEIAYGKMSCVWQEAENRLHAQKALLLLLADQLR